MNATLADIKPSLLNILTFFAMWVLVANLSYILLVNKFQVPGLTPLVARALGAV